MKKEKLKEIGRFVILWGIGLSIALFLNSCTPTECYYEPATCWDAYYQEYYNCNVEVCYY